MLSLIKRTLFIFCCLFSVTCSSNNKEDIYKQYTKICDIVALNYDKFTKTKQTSGEIALLYAAMEKDINKSIPSEQVRKSYFDLFKIGSGNPYELFQQEIKMQTGKDYQCDAFLQMTKIKPKSD